MDALLLAPAWFGALVVVLLGLVVGSFLNVVAYRLPRMMEAQWRSECAALLAQELPAQDAPPRNLIWPSSRCPHCDTPIKPWHNIPLLGYLWLRGRCAACSAPIGLRYPLVELGAAVLSLAVWFTAESPLALGASLLLVWALLVLTVIDIDHQLLPDSITLPLLWAGLLFNLYGGWVPLADAVLGAAFGYLLLWSVYWLFKLLTGKEGMGYGDFKLLAALGAWLGWQQLPLIVLLSSLVGAVVGIALMVLRRRGRDVPMPFGPYLAAAAVLALLYGEPLMQWWLGGTAWPV
jgi:leader peptidase (prepilin peptidase)/N-methyltransferase